ncbi:FMN-binding negative transcriptional regulator [Catellatospora coxensis]|uniref:PaiB family negative transcriptional regulator n=1 Tax=Catellatospora coxensis TaxID=310354 RepID=A0A8J3L4N6_9ACTN|nr:FMN-binding negative transcriptional regulator [Catellatospora coxensis]GIG11369.1 hypothetical protein Cco03nite_80690 [Catellatospora coxensis]
MDRYLTAGYRTSDPSRILLLVESFPFATIVPEGGAGAGLMFLPVTVERSDGRPPVLYGHADSRNPLLEQLDGRLVEAVFHGPNGYVSPLDYASEQFPTWNYAVAHLSGTSALIEDAARKTDCMVRMVDVLEAANGTGYRLDTASRAAEAMIRNITFFRIEVTSMYGVFKFGQEKAFVDRMKAHAGLLHKLRTRQEALLPHLADDMGGFREQR